MAYTQEQIDALEAAIAAGVRQVRTSDGSSVTYNSIDEMTRALAMMKRDMAGGASGLASGMSVSYVRTSRGL